MSGESDPLLRALAAAPALPPPVLDAPDLGDRYVVEKEIGRGGMGRVFLARDRKLGREVAVKVLAPGVHGEQAMRRFEQEARAAGALAHENIVAVYDVQTAPETPYIVSEMLRGATLREKLAPGALPVAQAIGYARQLIAGLCAAHGKGVIHRDLKPENLFVTDEGRLKILDFGIAKLLAPSDGPLPAGRTEAGAVLGTAGYMSPEQVRGEPADARSDLFSFGAILHEMVVGHRTFGRDNDIDTNYAILHEEPRGLPASVPGSLRRLVHWCLEKDPVRRPQSAAEVERQLSHPLAARARALPMVAALVLLAGLAVVVAAVLHRRAPTGPAHLTVVTADFDNQTGDPDLNGLSGMLIMSLEQSPGLSVLGRSRMFELLGQLGKGEERRIDASLGREIGRHAGGVLLLASVRWSGDLYTIEVKASDPSRDVALFEVEVQGKGKSSVPGLIDEAASKVVVGLGAQPGAIPVARSATPNLEAYRHYFLGDQHFGRLDFEAAKREFGQAIEIDPQFALAHFALGWVRGQLGEFQIALRLGDRLPERQRCIARSIVEGGRQGWAGAAAMSRGCAARYADDKMTQFHAGDGPFHAGDLASSLPYFEAALALDPSYVPAAEHLIKALYLLGRPDRMRAVASEFAAHNRTPMGSCLLAFAQDAGGAPLEAQQTLHDAAQRFPSSAEPALGLSLAYLFHQDVTAAEATLQAAIARASPGADRRRLADALVPVDVFRGRFRRALAAVDEAVDRARRAGDSRDASDHLLAKSLILAGKGSRRPARAAIEELRLLEPTATVFELYAGIGDIEEATALVDSRATINQRADLWLLALRAEKTGRVAEALETYEALSAVPDHAGETLYHRAGMQLEAGKPRDATRSLHRLQAIYPALRARWDLALWLPRSFYRLGMAHERAGDRQSAIEAYERFLVLWADADSDLAEFQDAQARLAELRR